MKKKDGREIKKKAVGFSENIEENKRRSKPRLTVGNFKRPIELDQDEESEENKSLQNSCKKNKHPF